MRGIFKLLMGVLIIVFSGIYSVVPRYNRASNDVETVRERIAAEEHIIHAGGYLTKKNGENVNYTNSLDALENMYGKGNRICEIDIRETVDQVLICAHGDDYHLAEGCNLDYSATGDQFMRQKLYGEFEPMTIQQLAQFMRMHSDLLVVTDTKYNTIEIYRKIANRFPDLLNQFVVQIYHCDEYIEVEQLGFPYIVLTLYRGTEDERNLWKIKSFTDTNELVGLCLNVDYYDFRDLKYLIAIRRIGIPVFLHTVNNIDEMSWYLRSKIASAVYTDIVDF